MPKQDEMTIAETYDLFGPQFWNDLAEVTREARRHLNTLYRNWSTMDALTRNSLMGQVHVLTTIDIYERIKSICEPRGYLEEFGWDIALGVGNAKIDSKDPQYNSKIITLYYWLLARYFYWLDRLGVLFRVAPPNLFASDILEEMRKEAMGGRRRVDFASAKAMSLKAPPLEPELEAEAQAEAEAQEQAEAEAQEDADAEAQAELGDEDHPEEPNADV